MEKVSHDLVIKSAGHWLGSSHYLRVEQWKWNSLPWSKLFHWYSRRGRPLLLAKVQNADRQDWYIYLLFRFVTQTKPYSSQIWLTYVDLCQQILFQAHSNTPMSLQLQLTKHSEGQSKACFFLLGILYHLRDLLSQPPDKFWKRFHRVQ